MAKKTILVTGCAGFIGMHIALKLIKMNYRVVGIDNLNSYYDIKIKRQRLKELSVFKNFTFFRKDLRNFKVLHTWNPDIDAFNDMVEQVDEFKYLDRDT